MSETYKVSAVNPETKQWQSQYGAMVTYTVMFEGRETPIEMNKKPDSPAPRAGDEVFGDINRTEYGDKFKSAPKPFAGGGFGGGASKPYASKSQDQFTMYLSYAKDLVVAMIAQGAKIDMDTAVQLTLGAGHELYDGRPDGNSGTTTRPEPTVEPVTGQESPEDLIENIDKVFGIEKEVKETAWQKPAK